jgi:gluconolactonase
VLGPNGHFRSKSFAQLFAGAFLPDNFQISGLALFKFIGPNPSFHEIAINPNFAFAHEAPIYVPETDEVFFSLTSNDGSDLGHNDLNHNNQIGKVSMQDVEAAFKNLKQSTTIAVTFQ